MLINEFSRIGRYHIDMDGENQDVINFGENDRFTVITIADGVSSCKNAVVGAEIASNAITNLLLKKGTYFMEYDPKKATELILTHILYELKYRADNEAEDLNEYSSTIASVLIDRENEKVMCFNLGDSIILATENGMCRVLIPPSDSSNGCCVTTTENAVEEGTLEIFDYGEMESVVICSDGAWEQMYENGKLKSCVTSMLSKKDFRALKEFLLKQEGFDDYSIVSVYLPEKRRKIA